MRAARLKDRPTFPLMRQTDVQHIYHMQMPRWLFSDSRYAEMSLDAKVTYTFLLNRFQLSRRNGWVNDRGEVFVIFPRKELARELRVCEQRVTAAFRKLAELKLIWEKRCGLGDANQIYLASVEPQDDPDHTSAPFIPDEECGSRTTEPEIQGGFAPVQEPQDMSLRRGEDSGFGTADPEFPEHRKSCSSYIEKRKTEQSHTEVSQSVGAAGAGGPADDEEELMDILDACELFCFEPEVARVFENAVERLFYSDSFRVGSATLPRRRVRAKLKLLDGMILRTAEQKLHANLGQEVKNSTAYVMATVFNCITEYESDALVDPDLNSIRAPLKGR